MRIYETKKANKDTNRSCIRCHEPVVKGQGYKWVQEYRGPKRVIHTTCGNFKSSELTGNDKLQQLYAVQEDIQAWIDMINITTTKEDLDEFMSECVTTVEEVAEMYRESASAIEDGFGHTTTQSEDAEANADACDEWAMALGQVTDDISDWDEDSKEVCAECGMTEDAGYHYVNETSANTTQHEFFSEGAPDREEWEASVEAALDAVIGELNL